MSASPWSLDASQAQLELGPLAAFVDLPDPARGIQEIRLDAAKIRANLLGVLLGQKGGASPVEAYVRGRDFVATYPPVAGRAMRIQIYWRCHSAANRLALELQVSVQTDELGIATPVIVASQLEAVEAWRLTDPAVGQFAPLSLAAARQQLLPNDGPGCLLLRLPAAPWSYAEMIHAADFQQDSVAFAASSSGARLASIEHRLFPGTLEKGVILRARLRGVFLHASEAAVETAKDYSSFLRGPLPLTT